MLIAWWQPAESDNGTDSARSSVDTGPRADDPPAPVSVSRVTTPEPTTVINETPVEVLDREVGPDAPRRERLFAAASAKGVPLRTILTVDAVVIATWVLYRLIGRLREVILWILIAAFIALVLNPSVNFLQRRRFRRGAAVGLVFAVAVVDLRRAAGPVRVPAGQLADPRGQAACPPWSTRSRRATAGWPTPSSASICCRGCRRTPPSWRRRRRT